MEASIAIKNLYLHLLNAYNTGDEDFMVRFTAPGDGILVIGSDPHEWWADQSAVLDGVRVQLKAFREAGFEVLPDSPQVFADGNVGWIADRPRYKLPDSSIIDSRFTAVVRRIDGEWKFVQQHFSLAVRNEEVIDPQELGLLEREATA